MLVVGDIAKLIAHAPSVAYRLTDITMAVAVNPTINTTMLNMVGKFYRKGSVDGTAVKLRGHQAEGGHVVADYHFLSGLALANSFFNELQASGVLAVEMLPVKHILMIHDAVEVRYAPFGHEGIMGIDMRP